MKLFLPPILLLTGCTAGPVQFAQVAPFDARECRQLAYHRGPAHQDYSACLEFRGYIAQKAAQ